MKIKNQKLKVKSNCKNVDWVFHLAAYTKKQRAREEPLLFHQVNVDGTISVLEAARQAGVKRFVFTGTASCYGIPDANPVSEQAEMKLHEPYALTKYLAERYVLHWGQVYRLPVVILRLFNVYGPSLRGMTGYGPTLSLFLSQKAAGKPCAITGDGRQARDFTYVSDIVETLMAAAASGITNEILNIATGKATSINRLIDLIAAKKTYIPSSGPEPDCLVADITKAKRLLGWKPKATIEEGIRRVLGSMKEQLI